MKNLLLTTIAAVVLVGCGPRMDIHEAAAEGNIEAVKIGNLKVLNQHIATRLDRNEKVRV